MSTQQTTQSLLKEYQKRLREDIKSIKENFQEIIIAAKFEEKSQLGRTTAALYDKTQIQVRAAKIVHAGENLLKLISDLKTFLVIHDFPAINDTIKRRNDDLSKQCKEMRENLLKVREDLGEQLIPGEDEFYSSLRPFEQPKDEFVPKHDFHS